MKATLYLCFLVKDRKYKYKTCLFNSLIPKDKVKYSL